jgi:hypothetical protein
MPRYSSLTRAMNWSAVSPAGAACAAVVGVSAGVGAFLQAASGSRLAAMATASRAWRWVTGGSSCMAEIAERAG